VRFHGPTPTDPAGPKIWPRVVALPRSYSPVHVSLLAVAVRRSATFRRPRCNALPFHDTSGPSPPPTMPTTSASPAIFSLSVLPRRLDISSDDAVTAMAAASGLLWVGTELGRLIRYIPATGETDEMRGRVAPARLACAIWRIFPDPHSRSALVVLRNADVYYAAADGQVRPRLLAKLRGIRVVAATWISLASSDLAPASAQIDQQQTVVALLGTAFGSVFLLSVDTRRERDDRVQKLWSAPSGEHIDGIRVERVASSLVGTIATASALYMLYGAGSLQELFSSEEADAVHRVGDLAASPRAYVVPHSSSLASSSSSSLPPSSFEPPLPSELQFMSGSTGGGGASRRFVWAAHGGILQAQIALRSHRSTSILRAASSPSAPCETSAITATVTEKTVLTWQCLKAASGSSVPVACNLSSFHVLVLYPGCVYAYNQISGVLAQVLDVWTPASCDLKMQPQLFGDSSLLQSPAAGFVRDVAVDSLWLYTVDGQLATVHASEEEQRNAWFAAKAVGRFDLAMALAPLVSGLQGTDVVDFAQSREAVLEAQAEHAAASGNWDVAARLFSKTNRSIESVLIDIAEACARGGRDGAIDTGEGDVYGRDSSSSSSKLMIAYLVYKLDAISETRPSQRAIVTTLLVELYASCLARLSGAGKMASMERLELHDDFRHFLADHTRDLHVRTALSILTSHMCYGEARYVAILAGDFRSAVELCLLHSSTDDALAVLNLPDLSGKDEEVAELLESMSGTLAGRCPQRLAAAWASKARRGNVHLDHSLLLSKLAHVARSDTSSLAREAYDAVCGFVCSATCEYAAVTDCSGSGEDENHASVHTNGDADSEDTGGADALNVLFAPLSPEWHDAIRLLFALHAECGTVSEADMSYMIAVRQHEQIKSDDMRETIGNLLVSCHRGKFWGLLTRLYGALELHEEAVSIALECGGDAGSSVAEAHVCENAESISSRERVRKLWLQIARANADPLGVAQRSNGVLLVDDALPLMKDFTRAENKLTAAVEASLVAHQKSASQASEDAQRTLGRTAAIRDDIDAATKWRARTPSRRAPCGHDRSSWTTPESLSVELCPADQCPWCGPEAVKSIVSGFL
jgi:Pep3/Vps18/deep orange family